MREPKDAGRRETTRLSHVGEDGAARMVDVSNKAVSARAAEARGLVRVSGAAMRLVRAGALPKGAVEETARLAGILAAKRTADAIPMCHPLLLSHVDVRLRRRREGFEIRAAVRTSGQTGVEMEALHAVALAALTAIDMVKGVDRLARIESIELVSKSGGRSGRWRRGKA